MRGLASKPPFITLCFRPPSSPLQSTMHTASTPPYTHVNALSPNRILHVLAYSPADGELDAPITVRLHCQSDLASNIYIRLVVGQKPVHSRISAAPVPDAYGQWQLNAAAPRPPAFAPDANSLTVDLSVQALNEQGQVLDSVAFGHFTYWRTDSPSPRNRHLYVDDAKARRRRATSDVTRMPDGPRRPRTYTMPSQPQGVQLHRRQKAKSISRSRAAPTDDYVYEVPVLELVTPLEEICKGWDADELDQGRRLISVQRVFHGRKLIVTCSVLRQEDYRPSDDCVISCIYHEQSNTCFVTSVDIIYLLERLTQQDFPVEEKNRIRRNLEGLRPTTVSKHRAGYESFFQRIMDFPDPKPRNIEKDLKVFEFTLLGQALDKILSKYECRIPKESSGSGIPTLAPSFGRGGSPHSAPSEPRSSASPTMSAYHLPSYNPQLHIVTQPGRGWKAASTRTAATAPKSTRPHTRRTAPPPTAPRRHRTART